MSQGRREDRLREAIEALLQEHPELTEPEARARLAAWLQAEEARRQQPSIKIFVRMPPDLVAGIEAYMQAMRKAQPGLRPNRSDAVRALLYKALAAEQLLPLPCRPPQQP
jgi:hypothetical protein